MRTRRFIATTVASWLLLVLSGAALFVWLATSVERFGEVESGAVWLGLVHLPGILVRILPLCVLLGVALAVARMDHKGERMALWILGHGVLRTGAVVGSLGIALGLGGLLLQHGPIAQLEHGALAKQGVPTQGWVWSDGRALRAQDGRVVEPHGSTAQVGRLTSAADGEAPEAWISLHPSLSSNADLLASSERPQRLELHVRLSRVLSCGLLAFWAWVPRRRGRGTSLVAVVMLGLGWSLLELTAQGLAGAGSLSLALGAWTPPAVVGLLCAARVLRNEGVLQSKIHT